jgi:hypothetical protein
MPKKKAKVKITRPESMMGGRNRWTGMTSRELHEDARRSAIKFAASPSPKCVRAAVRAIEKGLVG